MKIECPECGKEKDMTDKMPDTASEETEVECECGAVFDVGWYATAEVRRVVDRTITEIESHTDPSPFRPVERWNYRKG